MWKQGRPALAIAALGLSLVGVPVGADAVVPVYPLANPAQISFTVGGPANATPYPSFIQQFGMSTTITDVNVGLKTLNDSLPANLDIEVVSPEGTAVVIMSDVCSGGDVAGIDLTFDDQAATTLPENPFPAVCMQGSYKPSDIVEGAKPDVWAVNPSGTSLAAFNGQNPNGVWRLYVRDDDANGVGTIAGGWTVQITTAALAPISLPAFDVVGGGSAAPYPIPLVVSGRTGLTTDVDLHLAGLSHNAPQELDLMLVDPAGVAVKVMSDACSDIEANDLDLTIDDQALNLLPDGPCFSGSYRPTDYDTSDFFNPPAPIDAAPATMAAFNGTSPNGTWKLYVMDDTPSMGGGWLTSVPTLAITTTDVVAPETTITKKPKTSAKVRVKVKFVASEAGSSFECQVDGKPFKPCRSPLTLRHLRPGKHKVLVRAIDAAGNVDPTPARVSWKVRARR